MGHTCLSHVYLDGTVCGAGCAGAKDTHRLGQPPSTAAVRVGRCAVSMYISTYMPCWLSMQDTTLLYSYLTTKRTQAVPVELRPRQAVFSIGWRPGIDRQAQSEWTRLSCACPARPSPQYSAVLVSRRVRAVQAGDLDRQSGEMPTTGRPSRFATLPAPHHARARARARL